MLARAIKANTKGQPMMITELLCSSHGQAVYGWLVQQAVYGWWSKLPRVGAAWLSGRCCWAASHRTLLLSGPSCSTHPNRECSLQQQGQASGRTHTSQSCNATWHSGICLHLGAWPGNCACYAVAECCLAARAGRLLIRKQHHVTVCTSKQQCTQSCYAPSCLQLAAPLSKLRIHM